MHVELDAVGAGGEGERKARQRVLAGLAGHAPVRDAKGALRRHGGWRAGQWPGNAKGQYGSMEVLSTWYGTEYQVLMLNTEYCCSALTKTPFVRPTSRIA